MLGAFISASRKFATQIGVLKKTCDRVYCIKNSFLSQQDKLVAYQVFLLPQVLFATPCIRADPDLMQSVHRPALEMALNALGINRNYPLGW